MSPEEEQDLEKTIELVLTGSPEYQRTSLRASLQLFYNIGYRNGYNEAMADAEVGRDQRVVAHLN